MGLNICLYQKGHKEHPTWDWGRLGGDREFVAMMADLPKIEENWSSYPDFEWHTRPADFAAWRAAIAAREWPNPGRFEHLMDLLEQDPSYWIYISW